MAKNTKSMQVLKRSYKDHCIGEFVKYPAVAAFGKNDKELETNLFNALKAYKKALKNKTVNEPKREIIEIGGRVDIRT